MHHNYNGNNNNPQQQHDQWLANTYPYHTHNQQHAQQQLEQQQLQHYAYDPLAGQKPALTTTAAAIGGAANIGDFDAFAAFSSLQQSLTDDFNDATLSRNYTLSYDYGELSGGLTVGGGVAGNGAAAEDYAIPSLTLLFITIFYGLVVFGGVLGNATLMLTLCSASSSRLRNPLLLAVCIADLLVTGLSAPLTLLNLAMSRKAQALPSLLCKIIHYVQAWPVAASTISFFMLSLDRYATVKHPRLAQLRQSRYLHLCCALLAWLASAAISAPFLFAYKIIVKTVGVKGGQHGSHHPAGQAPGTATTHNATGGLSNVGSSTSSSCMADLSANSFYMSFIICHTIAVFVIPGLGVLLNHYGVRQKLCALSLTARAAHGELPLPMPILRRQTHMVIVTGLGANAQQAAAADDTSNDTECGGGGGGEAGDIRLHNLQPHRNVIKSSNPISPRAMREIRAYTQRQRISGNCRHGSHNGASGSGWMSIPLPQTSTLRSRRRLANMLIASALIFIACWAPHVFCIFYKNLGYKHYCSNTSVYLNLLLGYTYSAISPLIYWALNHNTLRQSPCAPIIRLRSMQNFLRTRFRSHTVPPPPPSSTNEAALGAFNPKLIKLTPKQYRAQASSHYLY